MLENPQLNRPNVTAGPPSVVGGGRVGGGEEGEWGDSQNL